MFYLLLLATGKPKLQSSKRKNDLGDVLRTLLPALIIFALAGCQSMAVLPAQNFNIAYAQPTTTVVAGNIIAAGGGREQTGYVGAGISAVVPTSGDLDTSLQLEVNYNHNLKSNLALEFALSTSTQNIDAPALGDLTTLGISAMAQTGRSSGAAKWFTGAGLAYLINDISNSGTDADNVLGLLLGAGLELPLTGSLDSCIELRYQIAQTETSAGGAVNMNALLVRANFVFKF